jgi:hypothetical protein
MSELWQSLSIVTNFQLPRSVAKATDEDDIRALTIEHSSAVFRHYSSLVKGWFDRAKEQMPLYLHFWLEMNHDPADLEITNSVSLMSEVLTANAHRFRYLEVGANRAVHLQSFLANDLVTLNHLESLVLHFRDLGYLNSGVVAVFRSAPQLRRVSLSTLTIDWPSLLPWSKLTHLGVTYPTSLYTCIALLQECIDLQNGLFYIRTEDTSMPGILSEHTLPNLSCLRLVFLGQVDGNIFKTLRLPALNTLKLQSFIGVQRLVTPLFPNLRQLMPSLTSFTLINVAIEINDLLDLLRLSPNLIKLEFAGSGSIDHNLLFKRLSYARNRDTEVEALLLPKLEMLSLHVPALELENVIAFPISAFVDMIKSRRDVKSSSSALTMTTGTLSCLSHLTFSARDERALEQVEHSLTSCCNEGLSAQFQVITDVRWGLCSWFEDLKHWY